MKYLADTITLTRDGILTPDQAAEIERRSRAEMVALAINILLFFGILAVIGGAVALLQDLRSITLLGAAITAAGAVALARTNLRFRLLANASAVIGSCMFVGGAVAWIDDAADGLRAAAWLGLAIAVAGYALFAQGHRRLRFLAGWLTFLGVAAHLIGLIVDPVTSVPSWVLFHYAAALLVLCGMVLDVRLVTALSMLAFATALSSKTFYATGVYGVAIYESTLTILQMAALAGLCLWAVRTWPDRWGRHAAILGRLAFIWMNMAFWIGSIWGDVVGQSLWGPRRAEFSGLQDGGYEAAQDAFLEGATRISADAFALAWAVAILGAGLWAALSARRGVFNTAVTFGAIHFYTQYFERLIASPGMILGAGLIAIAIAYGAWLVNERLAGQAPGTGPGEGIAPPPAM